MMSKIKIPGFLKSQNALILIIGLIAIGLRFWQLSTESLTQDELTTAKRISFSWNELWNSIVEEKNHPPLHYFLVKVWCDLFGASEFHLRFWSAVTGSAAVWITWLAGKKLFSPQTGLLSAALLTLSAFAIHYSQEARFYSVNIFLTTLSTYFFICIVIDNKFTPKVITGYIIASTLMLYNHYYALFTLAAHGLFILLDFAITRQSFSRLFKTLSLPFFVCLLFLPWLGILLGFRDHYREPCPWLLWYDMSYWQGTLTAFCGEQKPWAAIILCVTSLIAGLTVFMSNRIIAAASREKETGMNRLRKMILMFLWVSMPILIPLIGTQILSPMYGHKYSGAAITGFFIIGAEGVFCLRNRFIQTALILGLLTSFVYMSYTQYYIPATNDQAREAVAYIEENAQSNERIIYYRYLKTQRLAFDYYQRRADLNRVDYPPLAKSQPYNYREWTKACLNDLTEMINNQPGIWLVLALSGAEDRKLVLEHIDREMKEISRIEYKGFEIIHYVRPKCFDQN